MIQLRNANGAVVGWIHNSEASRLIRNCEAEKICAACGEPVEDTPRCLTGGKHRYSVIRLKTIGFHGSSGITMEEMEIYVGMAGHGPLYESIRAKVDAYPLTH